MNRKPLVRLCAAVAVGAFPTWLAAQTTAPGTAQPESSSTAAPVASSAAEDEELITLSPFEVTAERDTGYQATETLAGTRIRTDLRDVGGAISVLTRDFLADIGATDSGSLLQYTPNAEVSGTRGTYGGFGDGSDLDATNILRNPSIGQRVRGLLAADNTRDFFVTDIPWDGYNVERIDIQRGPNSILFGLGSPAGIVNAQLRTADYRTRGEVQGRFGSYGSWRTSLDYNQEIVDDVLAVRVAGLWDREKFRQRPAFENDERYYGSVRFDPQLFRNKSLRTSIRLKYEHGDIDANRPRILPPNDSITPWFRPLPADQRPLATGSQWTLTTGMGKTPVNNGYDSFRGDMANIVAGGVRGYQTRNAANPNYQPWLGGAGINQQQPFWLLDGTTGQTYRIVGGYINPGARNANGTLRSATDGILNKRYADQFFGLNSMAQYANNANLPLAGSGQYRTVSLADASVFDFYNNLIDGPTKSEFEKWDAYNVELQQTAFDDRLGLQLIYDRQKYERGGESLLGGSPTLTLDILQNFQDYYLTYGGENPADDAAMNAPIRSGSNTLVTNPNFGRPYVTSNAGGSGSSYYSDRRYMRASLFGELRATDFSDGDLFQKLFGKHRLNAVFSNEEYFNETRGWNRLANSRDWAGYWNGNDGGTSSVIDRVPVGIIYLGSSISSRGEAAGADIPGIRSSVDLNDGNAYVFDSTWRNFGVNFGDPWNVPNNLYRIYGGVPAPGQTTQLTQASNPANYVGWSNFPINLLRYDGGRDNSLLSSAQKLLRETESIALSWQGYFWNDAIIPTIGWRRDTVTDWDVSANRVSSNRNILNIQPDVYRLPDDPVREVEDESTAYGGVVHVNRLFGDRDPLPINVSFTYSKSSNFQVTPARRDVYGALIGNPSGETKDVGIVLSTKDNKYSFRAIKYKTNLENGPAGLSNAGGIGGTIAQGLKFRNVFLYRLSVYDWNTRESPASRNTWGPFVTQTGTTIGADQSLTPEEGRLREDAAITAWNDIQAFLTDTGFFQAWGFTPQALSTLTDRSTYEATLPRDPETGYILPQATPAAQYVPDPANVWNYAASAPQGFTVTADLESKGYEFELTANPLPNWRIAFNASRTEATRRNVGGPALEELVSFLDSKLFNADGSVSWAGQMPQFGNTGLSVYASNYAPWRANYVQMKLQEGSNAPEIRRWRYNVVTNYTFREGFLKNVGVGLSYRWQDKVVIGYPVAAQGNGFAFDLDNPVHGPSEDALDMWTSYERKITDKVNWRIQLSVRNMFYNKGRIPISVQPDGVTWAGSRIKPAQEWFVTNTFSF